jgi:antitoxin PrlF
MRAVESKTYHSKLSAKHRTVLPRAVRERLGISPGDRLRYLVDDRGVRIEKDTPAKECEPFSTFSEWSSEADEKAFTDL